MPESETMSGDDKGDLEQQRTEEPAGRGTRKVLVVITLLLFLAIGIGVGIGIGAGIWKDGSSSSPSQSDLEALFQRLDGNQDGSVSVDELVSDVAARGNVSLNDTEAQKTLSLLDSDGDGVVSRDEFVNSADDQTVEGGLGDWVNNGFRNLWIGCSFTDNSCYCQENCPDYPQPCHLTKLVECMGDCLDDDNAYMKKYDKSLYKNCPEETRP